MAESEKLGEAYVEVVARLDRFQAELNAAKVATEKSTAAMQASFDKLSGGISKLTGLYRTLRYSAIAIAAVGLFEFSKRSVEAAEGINRVASQLGITTDALQEFRFAAVRANVSVEEFDSAMIFLQRNIGLASVSTKGEAAQSFRALGVEVLDAGGKVRATEEIFRDAADRISKIGDAAQANTITMRLFGRGSREMVEMLREGTPALDDAAGAARRLGLVLGKDMLDAAREADNKLDDMFAVIRAGTVTLGIKFIPVLERVAALFTDPKFISSIERLGRGLADFVDWVGQAIIKTDEFFTRWQRSQLQTELSNIELQIQHFQDLADKASVGAKIQGFINPQAVEDAKFKLAELWQQYDEVVKKIEEFDAKKFPMSPTAAGFTSDVREPKPGTISLGPLGSDEDKSAEKAKAKAIELKEKFEGAVRGIREELSKLSGANQYVNELAKAMDQAGLSAENYAGKTDLLKQRQGELTEAFNKAWRAKQDIAIAEAGKSNEALREEAEALARGTKAYELYNKERQIESNVEEFRKTLEAAGLEKDIIERLVVAREQYLRSIDNLKAANDSLTDQQEKMKDLAHEIGLEFKSAFEDAVVEGKKLREIAQGLIQDFARLALRRGFTEPVFSAFSSVLTSVLVGTLHRGGIAGQAQTFRSVSPLEFAGAPRFHMGSNEVPAILERGERVIPAGADVSGAVSNNLTVNVNASGGTREQNSDLARQVARAVNTVFDQKMGQWTIRQKRPGGLLS